MIKRILNIATILSLLLSLCGIVFAGVDRTAEVTVNSVVEQPTAGPVLDDFNDGNSRNNWWHETGSFSDGGASCVDSRDATSPQEGLFCLKLDYDVSASASYAGYWSLLGGEDLGGYTTISFWVKGTVGGEYFKVELKNNSTDDDRNRAAVYVTDYLDGGVTTSWQEVTIPFHNFVNLDGWSNMIELVFVFENSQSVTNESSTQGTIYIDTISFGSSSVNEVRIDYFGDKLGTCALGGNMGDMPTLDFTHSFTTEQYRSSPSALKSSYNVTAPGSWGGQFIIFGGGEDGWTEIPHDFSDYNYVTLWIKAKSATENPKILKVEMVDRANPPFPEPVFLRKISSTDWQKYTIPLSAFAGLNKNNISKMTFVYEASRIVADGGNKTGVLYIDNLQFQFEK
ncbi:MAG TPA: carbohydrate binding domain-containing protein [bacterium]|nr:carbohydrate binding domain-containing protein [bacterium]